LQWLVHNYFFDIARQIFNAIASNSDKVLKLL